MLSKPYTLGSASSKLDDFSGAFKKSAGGEYVASPATSEKVFGSFVKIWLVKWDSMEHVRGTSSSASRRTCVKESPVVS